MRAGILAILIIGALVATGCGRSPYGFGLFEFISAPFAILGSLASLVLYFLPTIIGAVKRKSNMLAIVLINVLLGWTLVGWIVALVLALTKDKETDGEV